MIRLREPGPVAMEKNSKKIHKIQKYNSLNKKKSNQIPKKSDNRWKALTLNFPTVAGSSKMDITIESYGPVLPTPLQRKW